MLAAFQGLSWLQRWKGTPESLSGRTRPRRHRARFRVESLEPRWLLSTLGASGDEPETIAASDIITISDVSADDLRLTTPALASESSYRISVSDDWSSAYLVPGAKTVIVNGSLGSESGPDLLKVHFEAGMNSFTFVLKSNLDDRPVAEALQIFDTNFKEYASRFPNGTTQSFEFTLDLWAEKSSSLFVKITLPVGIENRSGLGGDSFPYTLEISRNWFPPPQEQGPPASTLPQDQGNPYDSYPFIEEIDLTPPASPAPSGSGSGSPDPNSDLPLPTGPASLPYSPIQNGGPKTISLPVAIGPLPLRSSAPLGGALASPDSVTTVDRHEGAEIDLAAFDPARDLEVIDLEPRQVVPVAEPEAVKVVTLRGPGGLPLLATALIAGSTVAVRTDAASTTAKAQSEGEAESALPSAPIVIPIQTTSLAAEQPSDSRSRTEASGRSSNRSHRSSVVPGLTLAFALGVGLVLPDLVASLQFLDRSRPSLRLRLIRRAFKGR